MEVSSPRETPRPKALSPLKSNQRLDYNRLAEALGERGLVEPQALQHILTQCLSGGGIFTEILVAENHISDWDLSRVVCEVFGLPFLTPEFYTPSPEAAEGIDLAFLHEHALVPLDRFGKLLTVAMPGLTPSQVLGVLRESVDVQVLPVVSSVIMNRRWLQERLPLPSALAGPAVADHEEEVMESLESALPGGSFGDLGEAWGDLFDEGNAAVLLDLDPEDDPESAENIVASIDGAEADTLLGGEADRDGLLSEEKKAEGLLSSALESEGQQSPEDLPDLPSLPDSPSGS